MKNIQLAVFDCENTLTKNIFGSKPFLSVWKVLCSCCGKKAADEDEVNTKRYYNGEYSGYSAWVWDTLHILKKYHLKKEQFDEVVDAIPVFDGVRETFEALKKRDIKIAIISGGLKAIVDKVALEYEIEHTFASAEFFWNSDGSMRHWNIQPTDFQHKRSLLKILCSDLNISRSAVFFVGDGRNDCDIADHCGFSIGFNPHEKLRSSVDVIIEQPKGKENLSAILEPLDCYPFFSRDNFVDGNVWRLSSKSNSYNDMSDQSLKKFFRKFLVEHSNLTENSSRSYISYLNNIARNMQGTVNRQASASKTPLQVLTASADAAKSEASFLKALSIPLAGPVGRVGDLTSAAKQFYQFIKQTR